MGWLDDLQDATSTLEAPKSFFFWSGICAISAVLKKNVYTPRFAYKNFNLYANLYCLLVGPSGSKKGLAIDIAKQLVSKVGNTRVISGRATFQGILKELRTARTSVNGGPPITTGCCFLGADELASFLVEDPSATNVFTDLFDTNAHEKEYNILLKTDSNQVIKEPYIVLFGATNEPLFKQIIPRHAITGGFLSRVIVVKDEEVKPRNALVDPPEVQLDLDNFAGYLHDISKVQGPFIWTPEAKKEFKTWYESFKPQIEDPTGSFGRLDAIVLKVAMCLTLSRRLELSFLKPEIEESISLVLERIRGQHELAAGGKGGGADYGPQTELVHHELLTRGIVTRKQLIAKYRAEIDSKILDEIIKTLHDAGFLETGEQIGKDGKREITYKLEPGYAKEYVENYQRLKNGS